MSLADLDDLVLSCRTDEARNYVVEAVACYKAGAFRSCIVAAWIAVVYDLLAKIRELALGGDAEAQRLTGEIAALREKVEKRDVTAIKRILEIEHGILEVADEKFGFFDGHQLIELSRLRNDRQRCAHPTYQGSEQPYAPTPELARAHLSHAVQYVLAQPPVQGKAATAHIIAQVTSAYFPTDSDPAKSQLKAAGMDRPKDVLVKNAIDQLTLGFLEGSGTSAGLKAQRRTLAAIKAVHEMFPGVAEPRLKHQVNRVIGRMPDSDKRLYFPLIRYVPVAWDVLEQVHRDQLTNIVRVSNDQRAATVVPFALDIPALESAAVSRIGTLPSAEVGQVLQTSKHPAGIARAVDLYCDSKSYDQANARFEQVMKPVLDHLSPDQIRRILVAADVEHADLNGAHSFNEFTKYVYEKDKIPKAEILKLLSDHNMEHIASRLTPAEDDDDGIPF